jgi:5,6-dimethylbenzimidazole synthase
MTRSGAPPRCWGGTIADTGLYSVCLAIQNLWPAAAAEGLGVGWVSFYRKSSCESYLTCSPISRSTG